MGTPVGIPLPAILPIPGPPAAPARGTQAMPLSLGGGPSTVTETRFSPSQQHHTRTFLPFLLFGVHWLDLPELITVTEEQIHVCQKP
jgi:hypothetical protein